ncbi:MAG: response regulator [Chitinophagaceae bacterium]
MNSGIIKNLRIGYGISLILLIGSGIASYISIRNLQESASWVAHTREVLQELDNESSIIKDAETGQRGYLLSGEPIYLRSYSNAGTNATNSLDRIKRLTRDNPSQQENADSLGLLLQTRLGLLQSAIQRRSAGFLPSNAELGNGNDVMEQVRKMITRMKIEEGRLLDERTVKLNTISTYIPFIILFASLIGVFITGWSYQRVVADYKVRAALQDDLLKKDKEISERINIIQNIAGRISGGDYKIRVEDDQKDSLGELSGSLNKMAQSLDSSFQELSNNEWMQTGVAGLNKKILGEKDMKALADDITAYVAEYTGAQVGALYIAEHDFVQLSGTYALLQTKENLRYKFGEGLVGQCAQTGRPIFLDTNETVPEISFAQGKWQPAAIILFPFFQDGVLKAVIELGTMKNFASQSADYLQNVSGSIGIAIGAVQNRQRIQALLEEVQAQAEELQAQHAELENSNTEMEAQTLKLQASEEELRVQQEELLQANQELEERSRLLEERNLAIAERNVEIRRKAEELAESSKYKSEFLANMSHELRTPLNSILLLSRLLSENVHKNLLSEQIESAQVIQSSGIGLLQLIDEILDLSKIESGKMQLEYSSVPLERIATHMRQLFSPIAKEKNIDFIVDIPSTLPSVIDTDEQRLEQIIKNLLSNAFKFTKQGSVTFGIRPGKGSATLEFFVKDTGIGIPAEKQELIFEAFQQADGSTRRKFGGTGLGLSISRELSKLLGGSLHVESTVGKGSEFYVSLPVAASDVLPTDKTESGIYAVNTPINQAIPVASETYTSHHTPAAIPDDRDDIEPNDKVILIVEDDTNFAKTLLSFTKNNGYKAVIAVSGDQVKELAFRYKPVAILLDIILPIKNGWEVLEELKSDKTLRSIPVHIMSSLDAKKESLRKGAIDFIHKPLAATEMLQVFNKLQWAMNREPGKVLIVEENPQHAKALAWFLETNRVNAGIRGNIKEGVSALTESDINCVILDMGIPDQNGYEMLEQIKNNPGLENLPIIIFTGRHLSKSEEARIKKYADSIIIKTAHSYQRILDEVSLFLHHVENNENGQEPAGTISQMGSMSEVLKNATVLIADDDVRNIYSITRALELHQIKVLSAIDGKEALQLLEENPQIDLVLMDIMMPGIDGYEAIRLIRQQPKYRKLPILAVTAKAMLGDREKCIRAGASDYISKPVDVDQLTSLLRVWLYDKRN